MGGSGQPPAAFAYRWAALVVVSVGMCVVELDSSIVSIALPSIQRGLGIPSADLAWVVNAYLLAFGGFLLLGGRLADRVGSRRMFVAGMIAFFAGSAMNAVAPAGGLLMAGRALQGLGGAVLTPTTLVTINRMFRDRAERSRALAVWTAIQTGSVALGLILGGLITAALSWRWIFTLNLPVAAAAVAGAVRFMPDHRSGAGGGFDLAGAVTVTAGLSLAVLALGDAASGGWGSRRTLALLGAAALLLALFALVEGRAAAPMLPPALLRVRSLVAGNAGFLLASGGMYGAFFFSSLYAQDVLGYEPLRAGLALLPLTAGVLAGATSSQPLLRKAGVRTAALAGLGVGIAGALLLSRLPPQGAYVFPFLPGLTLTGAGLGLAMVPFTILGTSGVEARRAGIASGLYTASSYTGGAVGLAVLSTVAAVRVAAVGRRLPSAARQVALLAGYREAFLVSAVLLAAAAAFIGAWLRRTDVAGAGAENA